MSVACTERSRMCGSTVFDACEREPKLVVIKAWNSGLESGNQPQYQLVMTHYERRWAKYRKLRNQFWFAVVLCLTLTVWHELTIPRPRAFLGGKLDVITWLSWFLVVAMGYRLESFRCPRCGEIFLSDTDGYRFRRSRPGRCRNCGLRKFASETEGQQDPYP